MPVPECPRGRGATYAGSYTGKVGPTKFFGRTFSTSAPIGKRSRSRPTEVSFVGEGRGHRGGGTSLGFDPRGSSRDTGNGVRFGRLRSERLVRTFRVKVYYTRVRAPRGRGG